MRKCYFLFLLSFILFKTASAQYSLPTFTSSCTSNDFINNVSTTLGVSNISNLNTGCNGSLPNNYTYFNSMTVSQIQGQSFNFSVQAGTAWSQGFGIWIDWNQDFDFSDPGESVYLSPNAATTPFTGTISVPVTAVPGNTRMRVLCVYNTVPSGTGESGSYSFGECEDYNMFVIASTPCSGKPAGGTATFISGCPNSAVTATGVTLAGNMNYQWQKKVGCNGTWANINGATSPTYSIPSQTQPTYYRMYVICNNGGQSDTSTAVLVNSLALCYCPSRASNTGDEEIYNVTVNGASTPALYAGANACTNPAPGPGSSLSLYSNFTTLGPLTSLSPGQVVNFSISQDECPSLATFYSNGIGMWIDFNADGDFTDVGETVYLENTTTAGPRVVSGTFSVPASVAAGKTVGLRVITAEGYSGSSLTPCLNYSYGETEDYLVKLEYLPVVVGGGLHCTAEGSFTMSVTAPGITEDYSYLWTFPDGSKHTDSVLTFPAIAGPTGPSGTYKVVVLTYPCGGGIPDTSGERVVTIFVQPTPPPPVVAPLITYCQGSPADTIAIYGQNIKWYSVDTGGTAVTTQPVINTGTPGSFTYYVSQTFGGCESARVPVTVQVVPQAPPPAVTSPVTYCQNDPAVALQAVGQNLLWYSTDTGGVGTPVVPIPSTLAQGTFYWYVTQTIDGCESVRVPIEIHINYRPNALILGSRPFVCEGDTLSFTYYGNADGDANVAFNWGWPSGATILSGSGQGPYVVRFDSAGARTISLVVDNDGCMSPEAVFHIEVRPLPVFSLELPEQACQGDIVNVVINQATPGIDSFVWSLDGGEKVYASETAGPYGVRWNDAGPKTITVVGTDRTCQAAPVSDVINIRWLPDATITTPNGTNVCAGDSILVEGVYNPEYTYQWLPEQYFIEQNGYRQWARIDYPREITLNVTDVYNCKSSSSIWVTPQNCCVVSFPTAFTPNNDGRNDVFRPITQGNQKITSFVVKNRWGQEVFESADDRLGWDGRFGGTPQDMGTYFYYIKYQCSDGKFYEEKGEVMLVR